MNSGARATQGKSYWMLAAILAGMLFATQAFGQAVLNLRVDDSETALELVNETGTGNCAGKVAGPCCRFVSASTPARWWPASSGPKRSPTTSGGTP